MEYFRLALSSKNMRLPAFTTVLQEGTYMAGGIVCPERWRKMTPTQTIVLSVDFLISHVSVKEGTLMLDVFGDKTEL